MNKKKTIQTIEEALDFFRHDEYVVNADFTAGDLKTSDSDEPPQVTITITAIEPQEGDIHGK